MKARRGRVSIAGWATAWRKPKRGPRLTGIIAVLVVIACVPFLTAGTHMADDRPPGGDFSNPVVRAVDVAQPAIVRIATLYSGRITFSLCGTHVTLPLSGGSYQVGGLGSGAFISAHGDILTADHVVDIDKSDLDWEIFNDDRSASDIAHLLNNLSCMSFNPPLTASDVANGIVDFYGLPYTTSYSAPKSLVWQDTPYSGSLPRASKDPSDILAGLMSVQHQEAQVVKSSPFKEDDIALLHVDLTDTPSIQLDNSTTVAVEDPLTIVGFPGNGDVTNDSTNLLTPSVNSVMVSAIKTNDNGSSLIQVAGNVEHGDSGCPALDSSGHIVGIVSFGGSDVPGDTAFLRTSDSALTLIQSAGVVTTPGKLQTRWQQAFSDYAATYPGHWHKAAAELNSLSTTYPAFQGARIYRDFATKAAQTEVVPDTTRTSVLLATLAVAGAVLIVVLIVVLVFWMRRRSKPAVASSAAAGQFSPYGYPAYQYAPAVYTPPAQYGQYPTYPRPGSPYTGPAVSGAQMPGTASGQQSQSVITASSIAEASAMTTNVSRGQMPAPQPPNPQGYEMPSAPSPSGWMSGQWPGAASAGMQGATPSEQATHEAAQGEGVCTNGHRMLRGEVYCSLCGAARMSSGPFTQP